VGVLPGLLGNVEAFGQGPAFAAFLLCALALPINSKDMVLAFRRPRERELKTNSTRNKGTGKKRTKKGMPPNTLGDTFIKS
jgi:hypothetical protein